MISAVKPIPAILLVMPMAAQSPTLAPKIELGQMGCLVYIGEPSEEVFEGLRELVTSDELLEMNVALVRVQGTSPSLAKLSGEMKLSPGSSWALTDSKGRRLLQGNTLPSAETVLNALLEAGAKNPQKALRDFLEQHPDHLDARLQQLYFLRKTAEVRTLRALQIAVDPTVEFDQENDAEYWYRLGSKRARFDTSVLEGKKLSVEQDAAIWGDYARELQTLFESGDWRRWHSLPGVQRWYRIPAEASSQTMIQIYARHIPQIEAHLEEYPSKGSLWSHYAWAQAITKQGSARALSERLVPSPETGRHWLTEWALGALIAGSMERGDWEFLAEKLWAGWSELRLLARNPMTEPDPSKMTAAQMKGLHEIIWRDGLKPLLESLIKTNRVEDAETVILDIAKLPEFGDFRHRAVAVAEACSRRDLDRKWTAMKIPSKQSALDMDDLDAWIGGISLITPAIVLASPDKSDSMQVAEALMKGKVFDWRWTVEYLNPKFSDLMHTREGWSKGNKHWALINTDRRVLGSGQGLPTAEDIDQAFERSKIEPPVAPLRRFVSERPGHLEARFYLLMELKRLADYRASYAKGELLGNFRWLSRSQFEKSVEGWNRNGKLTKKVEEDQTIWDEYTALLSQTLPLLMESAQYPAPDILFGNTNLAFSKSVRDVAPALIPQIEANLIRQPTDEYLWDQWASLSGCGGQRSFGDIKQAIALSPLDYPLEIPPEDTLDLLIRCYATTGNWQGIIDLYEQRWEAFRAKSGTFVIPPGLVRSLLAAYLSLGKDNEAESVVEVLRQSPFWIVSGPLVTDTAKYCGNSALAKRWAKYKYKAPRGSK